MKRLKRYHQKMARQAQTKLKQLSSIRLTMAKDGLLENLKEDREPQETKKSSKKSKQSFKGKKKIKMMILLNNKLNLGSNHQEHTSQFTEKEHGLKI